MAKVKKANQLERVNRVTEKVKPWVGNRIVEARKLGEHRAARAARRWGAPAGVVLVIFLLIGSFLIPKNPFQQAKENLLSNPNDFQAQIILAEAFLANNQFEEAEKALLLAESQIYQSTSQVLGEQTNPQLDELWQKKHYSDPNDIKRLIVAWGKLIEEKPDYRDAYLQLAYLHYKLYENEEAKEYLEKALELDPNFKPAKELEKFLPNN
ncbi:hypothetical protein AMJ51_00295 [Microgenomates bacterium DG_75]|nr:MAG: hypothetical protein AMJ51_00295 [Microgenomates bacterium DG_75]